MSAKKRVAALLVTCLLLLLFFVGAVYAPWNSIASGYGVWTDYHGVEVARGTEVTATAGTTEYPLGRLAGKPDVTAVRFRWLPPSTSGALDIYDPPLNEDPKSLTHDGTTFHGGWPVHTNESKIVASYVGDWGIQAWFYDSDGNLRHQTGIEGIRAVSFHVIPEIPVVGTLGAVAAMLLSMGLFLRVKKA